MNQITHEQALNNLSLYTEPTNAGKMSRQDYCNAQASLGILTEALKELAALKEKAKATQADAGKP